MSDAKWCLINHLSKVRLRNAREALIALLNTDAPGFAIGVFHDRIATHLATLERDTITRYDLTGKYEVNLRDLETGREEATAHLEKHLVELGYPE